MTDKDTKIIALRSRDQVRRSGAGTKRKVQRGPTVPILLDGEVHQNALMAALEAYGLTFFYDDILRAVVVTEATKNAIE
jgi:hypothetical protein